MTRAPRRAGRSAWPVVGLIGAYIVSRLAFYAAGARFDLRPLATSWQILDPVLLRHALWQSVFFMPGQPPAYNLLLGGVLKLGGGHALLTAGLLRGLYSAMALASVLLLYGLMRRLEVGRALSFVVALVFLLTPALALYELIPYYTLIILVLLGAIAWLFHACLRDFTVPRGLALFFAMALLIYVRSMFQVEWFVVLVAFCALVLPGQRRRVLAAAVLPLVVILALYAKNAAITGDFATSDWLGMSLSKLTTLQLGHAQRQKMVAAGTLSPLALQNAPFKAPNAYPRFFASVAPTGIPVLDKGRKSTGHVNFNHLAYAKISKQARANALTTIKTHPGVYLRAMGTAWLEFWRPASDYPFLADNRAAIEPYSRVFSLVLAGQPAYPEKPGFDLYLNQIGILIAVGYLLAVGFGGWLIARCIWRRRVSTVEATLIFLWLNIMYVSVIGNAFEVDENQRFRFAIDPFIAATLAALGQRLGRRLGAKGRRRQHKARSPRLAHELFSKPTRGQPKAIR